MIIVGYQGIGKSTLAKKHPRVIDLESSNFFVNGERPDTWPQIYANIAKHLSDQGYIVCVSSHQVVRDALLLYKQEVVCIYPSASLKDEWIQKLKERYNDTKEMKDYKAWKNAEEGYEDQVDSIRNGELPRCPITDMDYDLDSIIFAMRSGLSSRRAKYIDSLTADMMYHFFEYGELLKSSSSSLF